MTRVRNATKYKMKIILDSDVIIHFIKGDIFSKLPQILTELDFVVLDIVYYKELATQHRIQIENTSKFLKTLQILPWIPSKEEKVEFVDLQKKYGLGESASMVYCKYHTDVLASSNWRDIITYCKDNNILYFSTMDFIYQAWKDGLLTETECDTFISDVIRKGSKLPVTSLAQFKPRLYYNKTIHSFERI